MGIRIDNIDITELYNEYAEPLKAYLVKKEKNSGLVDDIVQDSFLKLHLQLEAKKNIDSPKAWLFRVAQNLLTDVYRKQKIHTQELQDIKDITVEEDQGHGPEDCLLGIISSLPMKYKKAVFLVDVKGIKQTDAAQQLNIALATFKSHVQRGRKLVMQGYVDCCDYEISEDGKLIGERKTKENCKVCH